jgi:hypothetical protein
MSRAARLRAHVSWLGAGLPAAARFRRGRRAPARAQERRLLEILRRNAGCEYGRRHGFDAIRSVRDFQDRVPVVRYEDVADDVDAIARGRQGVLTAEPVVMMERTSGSSGAAKLVPYTASLLREFREALWPWMWDLYGRRPQMALGGAYWSVSPLASARDATEGGLPVGFEEELDYFGPAGRRHLPRILATPRDLARIADLEVSRRETLRHLLAAGDLTFVSVWHPSFFTLLLDALEADGERCLQGLEPRRAQHLAERLRRQGRLCPSDVWPRLRVVSCWASAAAAPYADELERRLPGVEVQAKGLLATEGVVSIPWTGRRGGALAATAHFLELVDESGAPRLVGEVEEGRTYSVLLTTGGGFYRYALGDRVEVVGWLDGTPLVEFVGRDDDVSDVCGEKLHERHVGRVVERVLRSAGLAPAFTLLAPEHGRPPAYALFVECASASEESLSLAARRVDEALCENPHYEYCRRLGQLGPVRPFRVARDAAHAYLLRRTAGGARAGSVKASALSREADWSEHLDGGFVDAARRETAAAHR